MSALRVGFASRIRLAAAAGLAGWVTGFAVSMPAQILVGWRDTAGALQPFAITLLEGSAVWAAWTLLLTTGAWCLMVLPCVLLMPPSLLIRFRWHVVMLALVLAVGLVLWRMYWFQDHGASRPALRFILYMPYGSLALGFAVVTASWYIRGLTRVNREA